jgi:hypothetical protein
MKKLIIEKVDPLMFKEFGVVLRIPIEGQRKPTLQSDSFKHYAELGFLECSDTVEFGITTFNQRPFDVLQLEQHAKTPELLFAIDGAFVMPVAPIIYKSKEAYPDIEKIIAIEVNQGEGVIFKDGIWHWAPYPFDKEKSSVLVGFKKGTCEDDIIIKDLTDQYEMVLD